MQSGTGLTEWSLCDAVEEKSIKWAKCLGFESKDQRKIAEYLRSIDDYARLVKPYYQVLTEYDKLHALPLSLKPTVEWDTVRSDSFFMNAVFIVFGSIFF